MTQTNNHTAIPAILQLQIRLLLLLLSFLFCQLYKYLSLFFILEHKSISRFLLHQHMYLSSYPFLTPTEHISFFPTFPFFVLVIELTSIVCLSFSSPFHPHINSFNRENTAIFPGSNAAFGNIHFSLQGKTPRIVIYASPSLRFRLQLRAK